MGEEVRMGEKATRKTRSRTRENGTPSRRWEAFERALAAAIAALDEECVILSAKQGNRFVQLGAHPSSGLRAEAVSNGYLEGDERLTGEQVVALEALGWSHPNLTPEEAAPECQPRGSPNFFRDFPRPVPCDEVARLVVRTLAEALGVADPSHLQYRGSDAAGHPLYLPGLRLADAPAPPRRPAPASPKVEAFRNEVREAVRRFYRMASLDLDKDGDIPLQLRNTVAWLRVLDGPLRVLAFCVLDAEVDESGSLPLRVLAMNARLPLGKLVVRRGVVFGCVDILVPPFVPGHLPSALAALDAMVPRYAEERAALDRRWNGGEPLPRPRGN